MAITLTSSPCPIHWDRYDAVLVVTPAGGPGCRVAAVAEAHYWLGSVGKLNNGM